MFWRHRLKEEIRIGLSFFKHDDLEKQPQYGIFIKFPVSLHRMSEYYDIHSDRDYYAKQLGVILIKIGINKFYKGFQINTLCVFDKVPFGEVREVT